jgi:hypothetical protein
MLQGSTEYLHIPIGGPDASSLDAGHIEVAIRAGGTGYDWHPADLYVDGTAKYLVGPASTHGELAKGKHNVYVRVTSMPEVPVLHAGDIYIT